VSVTPLKAGEFDARLQEQLKGWFK
jgi:hypothetical protein